MDQVKIEIETVSMNEKAFNNEEIKIVRSFIFDVSILDTFNAASLLNKIILEESIDVDTIISITYKEV